MRACLLTVAMLAGGVVAFADEKKAESKLPLCPVMEEAVDWNVKTSTDSGAVYFCCPPCAKKYNADPAKYEEKVAQQRAMLQKMDKVQVRCPVGGEEIDPKVSRKVDGKAVQFCCEKCAAAYEKDPAKYQARLADSYTYQVTCPVEGGRIDPASYVDLPTGERIYTCCKPCGEKLTNDPAKYAPKLAEQGINLNLKKLKKPA